MTLKTRRFLYIVTSIIFICGTPIVLGMSLGYSYDTATKEIIKTGGILISTVPKNSLITFDGSTGWKSPLRKNNLKPGTYAIQIQADKFHPIQFTLPVFEGKATIVEDIELVPVTPDRSQQFEADRFFSNPFSFQLLTSKKLDEETYNLTLITSEAVSLGSIAEQPIWVEWSPSHGKALLKTERSFYVVNTKTKNVDGPFTNLTFAMLSPFDENVLYAYREHSFLEIELKNEGLVTTSKDSIEIPFSNGILVLSELRGQIRISSKRGATEATKPIIDVPFNSVITALSAHTVQIAEKNKTTFVHTATGNFFSIQQQANHFTVDQGIMGYTDGNEAWMLNVETFEKTFLNRFDASPTGIIFSPKQSFAIITFPSTSIGWYVTTPTPASFTLQPAHNIQNAYVSTFSSENVLRIVHLENTSLSVTSIRL